MSVLFAVIRFVGSRGWILAAVIWCVILGVLVNRTSHEWMPTEQTYREETFAYDRIMAENAWRVREQKMLRKSARGAWLTGQIENPDSQTRVISYTDDKTSHDR